MIDGRPRPFREFLTELKNKSHPEKGIIEIYIADLPKRLANEIPFETARLGETSYNENGKIIPNVRPVFINMVELEEWIENLEPDGNVCESVLIKKRRRVISTSCPKR